MGIIMKNLIALFREFGIRRWLPPLFIILALAFSIILVYEKLVGSQTVIREAIEILKQEKLKFLVTDKITTQVLVESQAHSLLSGGRDGYLIGNAKVYYGIDLNKLTANDIFFTNNVIIIHLPEPTILDVSPDLNSFRFMSKMTVINKIIDVVKDVNFQDELQREFKLAVIDFCKKEHAFRQKGEIINDLSSVSKIFELQLGKKVKFE